MKDCKWWFKTFVIVGSIYFTVLSIVVFCLMKASGYL